MMWTVDCGWEDGGVLGWDNRVTREDGGRWTVESEESGIFYTETAHRWRKYATLETGLERERRRAESIISGEDVQNRMRLQGLWLLRQGRYIRDVAATIGCHPRTVQDWIAWYRQGGLAEVLRHRHGGHHSQQCRLSQEEIAELKQKAAEGPFRRVQDAVDGVKERYQVTYTWSGMYSLFRREGLRKKFRVQ